MGHGSAVTYRWTEADGMARVASPGRGGHGSGYAARNSMSNIIAYVMTTLRATFLPVGYPDSVAPEYLKFQVRRARQSAFALYLSYV